MTDAAPIQYSWSYRLAAALAATTVALVLATAVTTFVPMYAPVQLAVSCVLPVPFVFWRWPRSVFESKAATVFIAVAAIAFVALLVASPQRKPLEGPAPGQGGGIANLFSEDTLRATNDRVRGSWPAASSAGGATTTAFLQIGSETVQVPTPAGFVETSRQSQELWKMALAFSAGDARIAAHYVPESDLKAFEAGKLVHFRQFMLVQTPKRAEGIVATQAQFDKLRGGTVDMQRNLAAKLEPRLAAEVDRVSKAVSTAQAASVNVRLREIVPVSVDRNDSRVLIYTVLTRGEVTTGKKVEEVNTVASTAYCFVKGKVVMLAAYRQFKSPQDLQASRDMADSWANALIAAN